MILHSVEAGAGRPVILLHGLFGSARNLGGVQRALAAHHRVIAMDARNHGASPHAQGADYPTMAADVLETMEALNARPATVIGHSMGGKTAMRLALDHPDAVTALCVADIAPVPYASSFRGYIAAMRALPETATRAEADAALASAVPDPGIRTFLLQNFRPGQTPPWRIGLKELADALPAIEGWESPTAHYDGPTLFISGDRSDYIKPEARTVIRELFPHARFVKVRNAGHWLHADNLSGFVGVLGAFLARVVT